MLKLSSLHYMQYDGHSLKDFYLLKNACALEGNVCMFGYRKFLWLKSSVYQAHHEYLNPKMYYLLSHNALED